MKEPESHDHSFKDWLLSKHDWVEKTAGAAVLIVEILALLTEIYHGVPKTLLTRLLNLFFLLFIYVTLRDDFRKKFTVDPSDKDVARVLRFSDQEQNIAEIRKLVDSSNDSVGQLRNINGFILCTALLYFVLALQYILEKQHPFESHDLPRLVFHLLIDFLSYAGAFYLLRCFFVMYQKTIDDEGKPILVKQTQIYIFLGIFLMTFDAVATFANPNNGVFVSEFMCGVVNAVVFILFVARFESKLLDIPTWMLCILYLYAILQTCLPLVTTGLLTEEMAPGLRTFLDEFSSIVLSCCLVGKVALAAVLLYVINSKRLFYYFMSLRKIHNEEEEYWGTFDNLSEERPPDLESVTIRYHRQEEGSYIATITHPFNLSGKGRTHKDATLDLIKSLPDSANPQPASTIREALAALQRRFKPTTKSE